MRIIASLVGCRAVRYKLDLGLLGKERKMRIGSYQLKIVFYLHQWQVLPTSLSAVFVHIMVRGLHFQK